MVYWVAELEKDNKLNHGHESVLIKLALQNEAAFVT